MIRGDPAQHAKGRKRAKGRKPRDDGASSASATRAGILWIFFAVVVFTAAFGGVIGVKLQQERQEVYAEAERSQAREAAFLAERAGGRLAEALGALAFAGADLRALSPEPEQLAASARVRLAALETSPLIAEAALLLPDYPLLTPDEEPAPEADEARLRDAADRALRAPGGFFVLAPAGREAAALYAATPAPLADGAVGAFVARLDPAAILPEWGEGRIVALADAEGRPLAIRPAVSTQMTVETLAAWFGLTAADVQALARGGAVSGGQLDGEPVIFAAAPIPAGGLQTFLISAPRIDEGNWRRTLIFYGLMFLAPFFVAVGLSAVLLMQMDRLKAARVALGDSEQRFRLAIEGARCGVWDWNSKTDEVFVTDSLARMLGREGAAVMPAQDFLALFGDDGRERLRSAIRSAARIEDIDVEVQASGLPVWLHMRGRPWSGADGEASGRIVGVAIDITERKGAQARVAAAESRLRAALESMSESFVLWDSRQRLVLWNRKFRDLFDFSASALRPGLSYAEVETAAARAIRAVHGADQNPETYEIELADGRWLHYSERPTADGGLVSVGADITALKMQEAQLKDSESALRRTVEDVRKSQARISELAKKYAEEKIRAEEANRSKSEFLANMSHELRTPLNAVNGFSEIMLREMFGPLGDPRYVEYVKDIHNSGQLLLALINDILDMSKIEAGKMQLQIEPTRPNDIIDQCVRLVRGRAEEKAIRLRQEVEDLPDIEVDPRALKQILLNLMSNAVKFTPNDGLVVMRGFRARDGVVIQVADTGIGIAQEDLPRLGRPFEQIESQHSKTHQGSGLGLALSKSLVELHGGELKIESELGVGTTVSVLLPHNGAKPPKSGEEEVLEAEGEEFAADPPPLEDMELTGEAENAA